jgi:flavin reductase (DIM6/NTAB) family NADH-FMN oxidoreductase RutF
MVAINATLKRKTLKSILYSKEFCIAYHSADQVLEADYLGIASGYDTNKIEDVNFTYKKAEKVNAPLINEFKVSAECKLIHVAEVGSHTQLTGEVVNIQAEEEVLNEKNKIDLTRLDPLAYDDVGYDYYRMGEKIADSHKCGLKFRK